MAITLRRFLVVQLLLVWQGGFLFYAAVVVPTGTKLIGTAGQGAITARVTDALNAVGAVALAVLALELCRSRGRWACWGFAVMCHALLLALHARLDVLMADHTSAEFYNLHRFYLLTSTAQWLACLLLTWLTLRAWRTADGEP